MVFLVFLQFFLISSCFPYAFLLSYALLARISGFTSSLNLRSASLIIIVISFFVSIFWLTVLSQIGILSIIDTLGAFFGPVFGIMVTDFYLIRKSNIINKDIYSLEKNGTYYFTGGWQIKGIYSLMVGFIFSASTIWNINLMFLQSYSWIIGFLISSIVYYLLARK